MSRYGLASLGLAAILAAAGCTPAADENVDYSQVDEKFLSESVLVVATSRQESAPEMLGSTLFIDAAGSIRRVDNAGMDMVSLAHEPGRIGFSDIHRDYVLGKESLISEREPVEASLHSSVFVTGELVSFINGGFGDGFYEMPVVGTGPGHAFDLRRGFPWGIDTCGDEVWAYMSPGDDEEEVGRIAGVRRIEPWSEEIWTLRTDEESIDGSEVSCDGQNLVALGNVESDDVYRDVVMRMNIATGEGGISPLSGHLSTEADADENRTFWAPQLVGSELYAVASFRTDSTDRFELVRIDSESGQSRKVADIATSSDEGTHFRVEDGVLYVLDLASKGGSRVRAFALTSGKELGSYTFDSIDAEVNVAATSFEEQQFVRDFVVLKPEALNSDTKSDSR